MAQVQGSEATCIFSKEDLQRAIELGVWYDSEGEESSSDTEDVDSGAMDQNGYREELEEKWRLFWSAEQDEDDPSFLRTEPSVPRSHSIIVEELLNQLLKEETDFGGNGLQGHYSPLQDGRATGAAESWQTSVGETVPCVSSTPSEASLSQSIQPVLDDLGSSVDPERPKYYYIAYEMLTSERSYVQCLRLMEKVVHGAVKTAHMTDRNILPEGVRKDIFLNIGEIYALTFDLLQELEERLKYWDPNALVADVIAKRAPFFKLYSMYSERFDNAQVTYSKWLKSSKRFAELIRTIESGPLCKGLPVSSYMLCPIQRIPRYKLLLEDYLKHLPKDHPDLVNTEAALAAISEAASHMNSKISDLESQALVMRIQRRFSGKENLVAPGRKYIGRGLVDFLPGNRRKQRILFLFSDILLVAVSASQGKYKIRHKLQLKNVLVNVLEEPSSTVKNGFCVADVGSSKPFRFCTKSQEERNRWIKKLNRAKMSNSDHFTINKKSKYATVLNDPEAHNSIRDVLKDPSFEHGQPSWVRRSQSFYQSASLPVRLGFTTGKATPTYNSASLSRDEVDQATSAVADETEEIATEFVDEGEEEKQRVLSLKYLKPGVDNSLSSYMNQRSAKGDVWKKRWFVLTDRSIVCYEDHQHDEAVGAIPLAGCVLSLPTEVDQVKRCNVFKLTHSRGRTYFFQLPSSYDLERWSAVVTELLESTANLDYNSV